MSGEIDQLVYLDAEHGLFEPKNRQHILILPRNSRFVEKILTFQTDFRNYRHNWYPSLHCRHLGHEVRLSLPHEQLAEVDLNVQDLPIRLEEDLQKSETKTFLEN